MIGPDEPDTKSAVPISGLPAARARLYEYSLEGAGLQKPLQALLGLSEEATPLSYQGLVEKLAVALAKRKLFLIEEKVKESDPKPRAEEEFLAEEIAQFDMGLIDMIQWDEDEHYEDEVRNDKPVSEAAPPSEPSADEGLQIKWGNADRTVEDNWNISLPPAESPELEWES
ncbi:MAG: hypothetical protein AAF492_01900 [Verrucomicrobiota bacterium]